MRYFLLLVFTTSTFFGCVSLPEPVPEKYLTQKSKIDEKKLSALERAIITKNRKKKDAEKEYQKLKGTAQKSRKRADMAADELRRLEVTLAGMDDLKQTPERTALQKKIASKKKIHQGIELKALYDEAVDNEKKAHLELIEAELSALIAEREYEKAKIARAYLMKKEHLEKKQKSGPSLFHKGPAEYDKKYREFWIKQKKIASKKNDLWEESKVRLRIARGNLSKNH